MGVLLPHPLRPPTTAHLSPVPPAGSFRGQGAPAPTPASTCQEPLPVAEPATAPAPRPLGSIQRPNSFLFRSSSQSGSGPSSPDSVLRPRRSPQLLDEKEVMAQLRQVLESRLQRPLPEDLAEALASGVILCQLANQLRPRSVPFIHVPSPAVPKLSALKSRKNVESFLEACRKMGCLRSPCASPTTSWRRRGLREGASLHRCCRPRTAGTALGVEVGVQGRDPARTPGTEDRHAWALLSSEDW